jgi:hypothetical protein
VISFCWLLPGFVRPIEKAEPTKRQFVHNRTLLQIRYLIGQHETFHSAQMIKVGRSYWRCPFACPHSTIECTEVAVRSSRARTTMPA